MDCHGPVCHHSFLHQCSPALTSLLLFLACISFLQYLVAWPHTQQQPPVLCNKQQVVWQGEHFNWAVWQWVPGAGRLFFFQSMQALPLCWGLGCLICIHFGSLWRRNAIQHGLYGCFCFMATFPCSIVCWR